MSGSTDDSVDAVRRLNRRIKNECPLDERPVVIRRQYGMTQVCINTGGCIRGMGGSCTFCNYVRGRGVVVGGIESVIREILSSVEDGDESLLLGCSGSILDEREMPTDILIRILEALNKIDIRTLILETRLDTITRESLSMVEAHSRHNVDLEFGLESSNPDVLRYSLNKTLDLDDVREKAGLIHEFGYTCTANVILGAPLLTEPEQVDDAVSTILWARKNDVDNTVLFPMNIRRFTFLQIMYDAGLYKPVSHDMVIEVLHRLDPETLSSVSLSWSDSGQVDDDVIIQHPTGGTAEVFDLYRKFMVERDGTARRELLRPVLLDVGDVTCPSLKGLDLDQRLNKVLNVLSNRFHRFLTDETPPPYS